MLMKNVIYLSILISLYSCGKGSVPLISERTMNFVTQADYEKTIEDSIEKSLNRNRNTVSRDLELKYITVGLSFDFRVGIFKWKKSASKSIELHFDQRWEEN